MPVISVMIPTYKRTLDLYRCIQAVLNQIRMPDEIIIILRSSDEETISFLDRHYANHSLMRFISVTPTGVVAALNAGLDNIRGDIIAITDDDAAPKSDWLLNIEKRFAADYRLGGLGGRDWVYHSGRIEDGSRKIVGKVQWFGRVIGNHHLGFGEAREVDFLKGVNMSYRRSAIENIRFQTCLKGTGAQVHNEMGFSMAVKKAGWKLIYDPLVAVDHYPAPRFDEDQRNKFNPVALYNAVHNETYIICNNFGIMRGFFYLCWMLCVGSQSTPGFIQWVRLIPIEGTKATKKWIATFQGALNGLVTWKKFG
jgi:glycosyltransferase involved in cell wall biosynthesis